MHTDLLMCSLWDGLYSYASEGIYFSVLIAGLIFYKRFIPYAGCVVLRCCAACAL